MFARWLARSKDWAASRPPFARSPKRPERDFLSDNSGTLAVTFAVSLPVVFAAAWLAINIQFLVAQQSKMQSAADTAVLAAAKQLSLSNVTVASVQQVAISFATDNMPPNPFPAGADQVAASVNTVAGTVTVTVTRKFASLLADLYEPSRTLSVNSMARFKSSPICVLTLGSTGAAFVARAAGNLYANNCAIASNSTGKNGLAGNTSGVVTSLKACSAGGYVGSAFTPTPITDCPVVQDPLAVRPPPPNATGPCDYTNFSFTDSAFPLNPGVYCGGINIKHGAATFNKGDYILRGGGITVNAGGSLVGTDVGFYLTGGSLLIAKANSALSLAAPSDPTDPMVGLVFWEDPNNFPAGQPGTHVINSDNGQNLHGTVYFPQGQLNLGGNANVGSAASYTIIVANNLVVDQQANVVLNSNYLSSNIPVPYGVGNTVGRPSLAQ